MRILLILILAITLTACGQTDLPTPVRPVVVSSQPIDRPQLSLPPVDRIQARNVEWIIITPENIDEVFNRMRERGQPLALFALTEAGYQNVSLNTADSLKLILQQQAVIDGYEQYYIVVDQAIEDHNNRR